MDVRLAKKSDILAISRLYERFFEYNAKQQPQYYKKTEESGKYPKSVIESKSADLFVADNCHTIIGFIHISEDKTPPFGAFVPHKYAVIIDLIVEEAYRGQGIGKMLLDAAKQWSKDRGLDYIELMVLQENEQGITFYHSQNFKIVSHTMRLNIEE